jgi:hypothetical protein
MAKVRNVTVQVSAPKGSKEGENPYKRGSHKQRLFAWALEQGQFTKEEFIAAEIEIFHATKQFSEMSDEVRPKAWWNEFYNKHEVFVVADTE